MKVLFLIREENGTKRDSYYIDSLKRFGGEVITVKDSDSNEDILEKLKEVDAILLPGGDVVGPKDFFLIDYAISNKLRLLGICQGMQSMAVWKTGRDLVGIGDEEHNYEEDDFHHFVKLKEGSLLKKIYKADRIRVNSFHNYTVYDEGNFDVVGVSDDGLIEAIESSDGTFQIGVQWHPERLLVFENDIYSEKLFRAFLEK